MQAAAVAASSSIISINPQMLCTHLSMQDLYFILSFVSLLIVSRGNFVSSNLGYFITLVVIF